MSFHPKGSFPRVVGKTSLSKASLNGLHFRFFSRGVLIQLAVPMVKVSLVTPHSIQILAYVENPLFFFSLSFITDFLPGVNEERA